MYAGRVWALTMPARLGHSVRAHMQGRGISTGPIVAHPRSNRWSLLIRPDLPDEMSLFSELFRLDVSVIRAGGTIALPSPTAESGAIRQWVELPRNTFRPSGLVVVDAVRGWAELARRRPGDGRASNAE